MGLVHHPNIVTDGLIACWDAGNRRSYPGAGTTWTDLAGAQNGTMENMNTGGFDSQKGGIIEFDGTDEYVDMGSSNQILPGGRNPFTISLWLKPDSQGDTQEGLYSFNQPDDDQEGSTTYAFGILWEPSASGETYAFYAGQRGLTTWGPSKTSGASREDWVDTWCCITITYNGEGTKSGHANYRFYINDVNYALSDISSWGGAVNFNRLGNVTTVTTHSYTGDMANISIYNRALSAAEVKQNYEATKPRFEPRIPKEGLTGYWDAGDPQCFDGNMVNYYAASTYNLKDLSSGNIGEFKNMVPLAGFSRDNGGYWTFDGTDDRFLAGIGTYPRDMYNVYSNANGFTAAMWVNRNGDGSDETFFWKDTVYQFRYDTTSKLNMRSGSGSAWSTSADLQSAADLLSDDTWHFVVALANKSNDAREIWLDGVRVANDTGSGMVWGTDGEWMGVGGMADGSRPLEGKIAMGLVYGRALSAAEIKDFYNKTKARFGH